jgi:Predicted endonuclease containing a URI domain
LVRMLALLNSLSAPMYYIYVLQSEKDDKFYTGFTKNLKLRFDQHNKGLVKSTKDRRPLRLIYYEACLSQDDATKREKYLKSFHGKMFIKKRLKSYLTG